MKYCAECKSGELRQVDKFCFECGNKLIDMPAENCECGQKPYNHNAFCIKCGKELKIKEVKKECVI